MCDDISQHTLHGNALYYPTTGFKQFDAINLILSRTDSCILQRYKTSPEKSVGCPFNAFLTAEISYCLMGMAYNEC